MGDYIDIDRHLHREDDQESHAPRTKRRCVICHRIVWRETYIQKPHCDECLRAVTVQAVVAAGT